MSSDSQLQNKINQTWDRLESWLKNNWPAAVDTLRIGATESQIADIQKAFKGQIPADYIFFLQRHNGQKFGSESLFPMGWLLSTDQILEEYKLWMGLLADGDLNPNQSEADPEIKPFLFHEKWLPITSNGAGDNLCLDADPTDVGHKGQVVLLIHDDVRREVLFKGSFHEFFESFVEDLENGVLDYSEDEGGIAQIPELDVLLDEPISDTNIKWINQVSKTTLDEVVVERGLTDEQTKNLYIDARKFIEKIEIKTCRAYYEMLFLYLAIDNIEELIADHKFIPDPDEEVSEFFNEIIQQVGLE